jgi:hypothetical protein
MPIAERMPQPFWLARRQAVAIQSAIGDWQLAIH